MYYLVPSFYLGFSSQRHEDYCVGDYDDPQEAIKVADKHNKARKGGLDDVYWVYNDAGKYIRGEEHVKGPAFSP